MYLNSAKTIVIKIGSSLLIDENMKIKTEWLDNFVKDVNLLKNLNKNLIIVSSGAIALGCKKLKLKKLLCLPLSIFGIF